jgi:hypothetical protein
VSTRSDLGAGVGRIQGSEPEIGLDDPPGDRGLGRHLLEGLWVTLLGGALAVAMSWPMIRNISRTVPANVGDPLYFAWQLAWVGHALRTDPSGLWTTYAFQREPDNLAFTDTVLGYAPLSLLGSGQEGALLQLNLAGLVATTLAFVGAHALARALGARIPGGLVAGAGFAFAPWRLEQVIHINVMSTGGMALALAFLAYGHGWSLRRGVPRRSRPGWVLLGWAVACYQLTFGFALAIPFAYVLAGVLLLWILGWVFSPHRRLRWSALVADLFGGIAFLAVAAVLVQPYLRVLEAHPESRRGEEWLWLSPPWRGLLTAPAASVWWGDLHQGWRSTLRWTPEMVLLPGFVLIGLAVLGILVSSWTVRSRLALLVTGAVLVVLSLGTTAPGGGRWTYLLLYRNLPGWDALRTPGRLMIWVTLALCLLAAGLVSWITDQVWRPWGAAADPDRGEALPVPGAAVRHEDLGTVPVPRAGAELQDGSPGRGTARRPPAAAAWALGLLLAVPAALVTVEGRGDIPNWEIWKPPVALDELPQPILVLPSAAVTDYYWMTWQTQGWPLLANGSSGFEPKEQETLRAEVANFPDTQSVAALQRRGIRSVVLVRDVVANTPWAGAADRPSAGLPITRRDVGNVVVYTLS